jgi:hypothetical protein
MSEEKKKTNGESSDPINERLREIERKIEELKEELRDHLKKCNPRKTIEPEQADAAGADG